MVKSQTNVMLTITVYMYIGLKVPTILCKFSKRVWNITLLYNLGAFCQPEKTLLTKLANVNSFSKADKTHSQPQRCHYLIYNTEQKANCVKTFYILYCALKRRKCKQCTFYAICKRTHYNVEGRHCAHESDIAVRQSKLLPSDITMYYIVNKSREV